MFFRKKPTNQVAVFNTATREKGVFQPLRPGQVKMYSCGPTVYDYVHIGNLRSYVFSDIVRRTFEYAGYDVKHVMNFTDFGHLVSDGDEGEDKMTKGLRREGKPLTMEAMRELAALYINAYQHDREEMNILKPHVMPQAADHVRGMIAYIEVLMDKGFAYTTHSGVYFDTAEFPAYGVLGGSASTEHSRIQSNKEKKNPADFALWKFNAELGWDAPWGKGFPGWHIECTAMSTRYLGKTFDIHTGGVDLAPVHHNNEIAQAEAANGKPLARYWLHSEHVTIDAKRIGKSEGNAITLKQLVDKGISPLAYRYWLLGAHYRQKVNFTWEAVEAAQTALRRAWRVFTELKGNDSKENRVHDAYRTRFETALYDDFNTAEALAVLWDLLKDENVSDGEKRTTILSMDRVLGIGFASAPARIEKLKLSVVTERDIPDDIQVLIAEREAARKAGDFARADVLRDEIKTKEFQVEDTADGPVVKRQ
ncbi:MAG: cysteine--tRNA ligase [Candidatus Paceibacteria bacterium]